MKKGWKIRLLIISMVTVLTLLAGCGGESTEQKKEEGSGPSNTAQSKPILLKLSHPTPEPSFLGQGYSFFAKAVEEESKGQIKVEVYPAATLVSDTEILEAVQRGNVDIGHFMVSYLTSTIKELTPFEVPGGYGGKSFPEREKAIRPILEKIFNKYEVKYLGTNENSTLTFSSTDKLIKSPSDLKGLSVRIAGKWDGSAIKMWGGNPVTVSLGDLPVALERGTIDASYNGWIITGPFKLYESAPNITLTKDLDFMSGLIMSEKAWKNLNQENQQAVLRAAQRWMDFSQEILAKEMQKFEQNLKDSGAKVYILNDSENAEFTKVTDRILNEVKGIAGPEGEELIKVFESLHK